MANNEHMHESQSKQALTDSLTDRWVEKYGGGGRVSARDCKQAGGRAGNRQAGRQATGAR